MITYINSISLIVYLLISVYVTVWVGFRIYRYGEVFLKEIFKGNPSVVQPVNKILLIGYYLVNIGYVVTLLTISKPVDGFAGMVELLSLKIGVVVFSLGIIHAFNLLTFFIIYRKNKSDI